MVPIMDGYKLAVKVYFVIFNKFSALAYAQAHISPVQSVIWFLRCNAGAFSISLIFNQLITCCIMHTAPWSIVNLPKQTQSLAPIQLIPLNWFRETTAKKSRINVCALQLTTHFLSVNIIISLLFFFYPK